MHASNHSRSTSTLVSPSRAAISCIGVSEAFAFAAASTTSLLTPGTGSPGNQPALRAVLTSSAISARDQ